MRATRILSRVTPLLAVGLLTGCGGGGLLGIFGPYVTDAPASLDGYVTSAGGVLANSSGGIAVGDNASDDGRRGFVRFNITGVPSGATIVSAVLRMAQASVVGAPYASLGIVHVDHVNIGPGLDATDYAAAPLLWDAGILSGDATLMTKTLDVTARVIADRIALRPTSDFRLRFNVATDFDGVEDSAHFEDMENNEGTGQAPVLVITWN